MEPVDLKEIIELYIKNNYDLLARKKQTLEAGILYFMSKYKDKMSPELLGEYKEFFGIQTLRKGKI